MLTSLFLLQQGNVKKSKKMIKLVNIADKNFQIFWTTWGMLKGGFRVKIPKSYDFFNLVVLDISDCVENDGKIGFYKKPENYSRIGH